jgi:hypothetical protein
VRKQLVHILCGNFIRLVAVGAVWNLGRGNYVSRKCFGVVGVWDLGRGKREREQGNVGEAMWERKCEWRGNVSRKFL